MPDLELTTETPKPIPDYGHLTQDDIGRLKHLRKAGLTQVEIAQQLGCSQPTVSKWLNTIDDPLEQAKHILRSGAPALATTVVNTKHAPTALEALRDMQVSEKRAPDQGKGGGVQVFIGVQDGDVKVNIYSPVSD